MKTFKERQYDYQYQVAKEHPEWFNDDKCGGDFKSRHGLPKGRFILEDSENNLFRDIRTNQPDATKNVVQYFLGNNIGWWGGSAPTKHMCSSQIACLNHLFLLRQDKDAVLALANAVAGEGFFDKVFTVGGDKFLPGYISFEVVTSKDYLNESKKADRSLSRGSQCTSIDAVIVAGRGEKVWILPIEWKFVEDYNRSDKSHDIVKNAETGEEHDRGESRIANYFTKEPKLAPSSNAIHIPDKFDPHGSVFFQEPFYQLMRQTLWAEQVINQKDSYFPNVEDYLHVHVVPKANDTLRDRVYRKAGWDEGKGMIETWKTQLNEGYKDKYICIDPKDLFALILKDDKLSERYKALLEYLNVRYWSAK